MKKLTLIILSLISISSFCFSPELLGNINAGNSLVKEVMVEKIKQKDINELRTMILKKVEQKIETKLGSNNKMKGTIIKKFEEKLNSMSDEELRQKIIDRLVQKMGNEG